MKRELSPLKKILEESPKIRALKEKRKKARKRLAIFFGFLLCALVAAFVYASRHPRLQIVNVVVSGNQVVDTKDVVEAVEADLAGHYAYVIPRRNAFFYPKRKIVADLGRIFPRFESLSVVRTDLSTVLVSVSELRGHALWCGTSIETISNDVPCYFTDSSGKLVSEAPQYSGNVYLRFFGGDIPKEETALLGKNFVTAETFEKLMAFEEKVAGLGFNVRALVIGTGDEDTFVVDVGHGKTATIPFLKADDYAVLAANLAAALAKPELAAKFNAEKKDLLYFDLRFTNKVYYKFGTDTAAN